MTNDLISRSKVEEVISALVHEEGVTDDAAVLGCMVWNAVHTMEAVDAAPVVHASYGFVGPHIGSLYASHGTCGNCKERILIDPRHNKFCPNCGAKMYEEE